MGIYSRTLLIDAVSRPLASFSIERVFVYIQRNRIFKDQKLAITKLKIIQRTNGELTGSGQHGKADARLDEWFIKNESTQWVYLYFLCYFLIFLSLMFRQTPGPLIACVTRTVPRSLPRSLSPSFDCILGPCQVAGRKIPSTSQHCATATVCQR